MPKDDYILNLGSAGDSLGLDSYTHIHLDIVEKNLFPSFSICGNIQNLPFCDNSFEFIICVGSVINYCDAPSALAEISRVLRPTGYLILEFDKSESFEFLFTGSWRKPASVVRTFYLDDEDVVWVYSEPFVEGLLEQNDIF